MSELEDLQDLIEGCGYDNDITADDVYGETYVKVKLLSEGDQVGGFTLVMDDNKPDVCRFASLWLAEGHRDNGFLSMFGAHMEAWFREAGFRLLMIDGENPDIRARLLHMGVSEGPNGGLYVLVGDPDNPVAQFRDRRYGQGEA